MPEYRITETTSGEFVFALHGSSGTRLLVSEAYGNREAVARGIEAVRALSPFDSRYIRMQSGDGLFWFELRALTDEAVARGEPLPTRDARDQAIAAVKRFAPTATVVE